MNNNNYESNEDTVSPPTKESVEQRIQSWLENLTNFYMSIRDWADQHNWHEINSGTIPVSSEVMNMTGVDPVEQPILRLEHNNKFALFKPKGPWVIGAKGRVDLFTSKGVYKIIDASENNEPNWKIFRSSNKRDGEPFTPNKISELN